MQDKQLASLLEEVCSLNKEMKEGGGGKGFVKGALGLIGTVATLPLKTASNVVNNVLLTMKKKIRRIRSNSKNN